MKAAICWPEAWNIDTYHIILIKTNIWTSVEATHAYLNIYVIRNLQKRVYNLDSEFAMTKTITY